MANLNKVFMMGNLTRDPELRYLPNGTAVATFTLASNRVYTLQTGEKKQEATFMRVVVWGKRAETCGEYLGKGSSVFIDGRLQNRSWQGQDGQKRTTTEIVAESVQFLARPKKEGAQVQSNNDASQGQPDTLPDIDIPADISAGDSQHKGEDEVPF